MEYLEFIDAVSIFLIGLGLLLFSPRLLPKSERNNKIKRRWGQIAGLGIMIVAIGFGILKSMLPICFYIFGEHVCWNELNLF